jgi:hypothetical protein
MVCVMPLSAEPIQRPEQNAIELPFRGVVKQGRKLLPLFRALPATFVIDVLLTDYMARVGYPVPQLSELVIRVLTSVVGRYPRVDRYPHDIPSSRGKRVINWQPSNPSKVRGPQLRFRRGETGHFLPYLPRRRACQCRSTIMLQQPSISVLPCCLF